VIIQYGSFQEIEEYILNIEDKTGVFLIEPKGKGTLLVSSFATGKSEELRADLLESYFKEKEGTHAFFVGVRPPKCIKRSPHDRYTIKESLELCEKIMHLSIGNPSYDQIDYCLENIMAIIRDVEEDSEVFMDMLKDSEDRQEDIDLSGLDLFGNEDLPTSE
jgi:hypothetical protein